MEFDPLQTVKVKLNIWSHFSPATWNISRAQAFCMLYAVCFSLSEDPQLSLMTVDLVAFYGSIISVSFNDKELLIEVGPA